MNTTDLGKIIAKIVNELQSSDQLDIGDFWISICNTSGLEIFSCHSRFLSDYPDLKHQSKSHALRKAQTAASRKKITGFDARASLLMSEPTYSNLEGGAPILEKPASSLIGGIGISGYEPQKDRIIALRILHLCGYWISNNMKTELSDEQIQYIIS